MGDYEIEPKLSYLTTPFDFDQANPMLRFKQHSSRWFHLLLLVCIVVLAFVSIFLGYQPILYIIIITFFYYFVLHQFYTFKQTFVSVLPNIYRIQGVTDLISFRTSICFDISVSETYSRVQNYRNLQPVTEHAEVPTLVEPQNIKSVFLTFRFFVCTLQGKWTKIS